MRRLLFFCDESVAVEANKVLNSVAIETGGGGRGRLFNILVERADAWSGEGVHLSVGSYSRKYGNYDSRVKSLKEIIYNWITE